MRDLWKWLAENYGKRLLSKLLVADAKRWLGRLWRRVRGR